MKYAFLQTEANPPPTAYRWQFVSDGGDTATGGSEEEEVEEVVEVKEKRLRWRVSGQKDYGKMICWGENSAEGKPQPCTFIITPSVK